jgi:hypothetical protein
MKQLGKLLIFAAMLVTLASCAENIQAAECILEEKDGFWNGLIHGFISPFTFIVSLFDDEVTIYSICNNGGWYNFGFLLGVSVIFGAGGRGSK